MKSYYWEGNRDDGIHPDDGILANLIYTKAAELVLEWTLSDSLRSKLTP